MFLGVLKMQESELIPLCRLPVGTPAYVRKLEVAGTIRRRMLDLGIILNTPVQALQKSPSGDPTAYQIRGAVIAIRSEEASGILVEV
jgi:ferrous iron transport protein A